MNCFFREWGGAPEYFPQQFLRHDPNRYLKGNRTGTCVQCASKLKQTSQTFSVTPGAVQSNSASKFCPSVVMLQAETKNGHRSYIKLNIRPNNSSKLAIAIVESRWKLKENTA